MYIFAIEMRSYFKMMTRDSFSKFRRRDNDANTELERKQTQMHAILFACLLQTSF